MNFRQFPTTIRLICTFADNQMNIENQKRESVHRITISPSLFAKYLRYDDNKTKMSRGWMDEVLRPFLEKAGESGRVWLEKSCIRLKGCKRDLNTYVAYLSCREVANCKATFRIIMKKQKRQNFQGTSAQHKRGIMSSTPHLTKKLRHWPLLEQHIAVSRRGKMSPLTKWKPF